MKSSYIILVLVLISTISFSCRMDNKPHNIAYQGDEISSRMFIKREKTTKRASIKVMENTRWQLYGGPSVEQIDLRRAILSGESCGTFGLEIPLDKRWYFLAVTDHGQAILAEKYLPMAGGYNFRDLGGTRTAEGRYVKWGKLLRTDEMNNLTRPDLDYLSSIPVTTVVDFRSAEEISRAPDNLPTSVENRYEISIIPGTLMLLPGSTNVTSVQLENMMTEMNRLLVTDSVCVEQFRRFFRLVQNTNALPLLYHCTAGKDRTGMASALILYSLGVDDQTVMKDYLASNYFLGAKYADYIKENPVLKPVMEVRPEYLEAGLEVIRANYGTIDNYLETVLDVDIALMKELYLY